MKAAFCLPYDLLTVRLGHLPPLGLQMIVCRNLHIRLVLIFEGLKDQKLFIYVNQFLTRLFFKIRVSKHGD